MSPTSKFKWTYNYGLRTDNLQILPYEVKLGLITLSVGSQMKTVRTKWIHMESLFCYHSWFIPKPLIHQSVLTSKNILSICFLVINKLKFMFIFCRLKTQNKISFY